MDKDFVTRITEFDKRVKQNVDRVIVGKDNIVDLILVAMLCEGHVLLEDVPGIGKTMIAKSISRSLDCAFKRIQCTPDLLPADITGSYIFNQKNSEFEFKPGPIMAQIVLADEINRATPRAQAALLEAMQEQQITMEGETRSLPRPFMVLATQNPIELEGTFPLPEAQLDRFLLKIKMGYPKKEEDYQILHKFQKSDPLSELQPVISSKELLEMQALCRDIHVSPDIEDYIVTIIRATREDPAIRLGASPRAMLALYYSSRALAAIRGRAFVIPDDVKYLVPYVLGHRIITRAESHLRGKTVNEVITAILDSAPVPVEKIGGNNG
jgi:MoxR-like ATPase